MIPIQAEVSIRADGDHLRVSIKAQGAYDEAPFFLAESAWRDFEGVRVAADPVFRSTRDAFRTGPANPPPKDNAEQLFQALFPPELRRVLERLRGTGRPVHLCLTWDPNDERLASLHRLPWERMRIPETSAVLVLEPNLTFSRYLAIAEPRPELEPIEVLRVHVVAANPKGTMTLDTETEIAGLVVLGEQDPAIEVTVTRGPSDLDDLRHHLETVQVHVLHFIGHGDIGPHGKGRLIFEGEDRAALAVSGDSLARALQMRQPWIRLIVLNACWSGQTGSGPLDSVATCLVRAGLPAVIGMQTTIRDDLAVLFSRELYVRIARGHSLESAVCEARHAIHARVAAEPGCEDWAIPVLFSSASGRTAAGSLEGELPPDQAIVRERYLRWLLEQFSETDRPDGGSVSWPRLPLQNLYGLFRSAPESQFRRPLPETEQAPVEGTLDLAGKDAREEDLLIWRHLRRLARGRDRVPTIEGDGGRFSFDELLLQHQRLVLLGEAGSGKTSVLRWLCLRLAECHAAGHRRLHFAAHRVDPRRVDDELVDLGPIRLPVLVDLAVLARHRQEVASLRLAEYLGRHLGPDLETPVSDATGGKLDPRALNLQLRRELRQGRGILLCDGLDQIPDPEARREIVREIEGFLREFGCPAIITRGSASHFQEPLRGDFQAFEFEPLDPIAVERLCRSLAGALAVPEETLLAAIATLHGRGEGELLATPLLVTTMAASAAAIGGILPRRVDLYKVATEILLWRSAGGSETEFTSSWRRRLSALAAAMRDRPGSYHLVDQRHITTWLEMHGENIEPKEVERIRDGVGPLVPIGTHLFGFLHPAIEEFLAATWLASEPETAAERIARRLPEPTWRAPSAMAIGLLADQLPDEDLRSLLGSLLAERPAGEPLPLGAILLLEALAGLPQRNELPIAEIVTALLGSMVPGNPAFERFVVTHLASTVEGAHGRATNRALARVATRPEMLSRVARVARAVRQLQPPLAEALISQHHLDEPPWCIDGVLARVDVTLLPRWSAARMARSSFKAATFVQSSGPWRRLMHAVCGNAVQPYRPTALDDLVSEALRSGHAAGSMKPELRRLAMQAREPGSVDARLALMALGEIPTFAKTDQGSLLRALDRLTCSLPHRCDSPRWTSFLEGFLPSISRSDQPAFVNLLAARGSFDSKVELFFISASAARGWERSQLLGSFWQQLLQEDSSLSNESRTHQVAIILDRHGSLLYTSVGCFVESWLSVGRPQADISCQVDDRPSFEQLAAVLDVLASIPDSFDFVRAWALVLLRDALETHGLLVEAGILAEVTLSDRFDALGLARRAYFGSDKPQSRDSLLGSLEPLDDLRRERALARLSSKKTAPHPWARPKPEAAPDAVADERLTAALIRFGDEAPMEQAHDIDTLVLGALADVARRKYSCETRVEAPGLAMRTPLEQVESGELNAELVDQMVSLVEHGDDLSRLRASLALHGDRSALRRRWPASRVGSETVRRLADHWLRCRRRDPRTALVLRWALQAVEHDRGVVLLEAAEDLADPGRPSDSAGVVLRVVETVYRDALPALREILEAGEARARQDLVRGLPNLLADESYRADLVWAAVHDRLPAAAELCHQRVHLGGPESVVAAAETAVPAGDVEAVLDLYERMAVPWSDLLCRNSTDLRAALRDLGQQRRVGSSSGLRTASAVTRVVERPALLPILVDWLDRFLATFPSTPDDSRQGGLLEIVAGAAHRVPHAYFESTRFRNGWDHRLAEAVESSEWLSSRRAAVQLLGMGRQLGARQLQALLTALLDAVEMQQATLSTLSCYRRLEDPEAIESVAAELHSDRPSRAFAAARLLAAIATPPQCESEVRQQILTLLKDSASAPTAQREVFAFDSCDDAANRRLSIRCLGRLDHLIRAFVLEIHGWTTVATVRTCETA